ncbi:MAG: PduL/EutD family phosphate acyltransferase [Elusimicrobiota bacterium]
MSGVICKVTIGIDPRHIHLSDEHFKILFGADAKPRKLKNVVQPGYYSGWETVTLLGPKGEIPNARLVHPGRSYTQVEVTRTDAIRLGIKAPLRKSGDIFGSAPVTLVGPAGRLELKEGCIVPWRHIHMHTSEAAPLGLKHNDFVRVRAGAGSGRETIFENVWMRVTDWWKAEFHLDADEANAAGLKSGDAIEIVSIQQDAPQEYAVFPPEEDHFHGNLAHPGQPH